MPIHHGSTDAGDSPVGITATNPGQPQVIPPRVTLWGIFQTLTLVPQSMPQVLSMQMRVVDLE